MMPLVSGTQLVQSIRPHPDLTTCRSSADGRRPTTGSATSCCGAGAGLPARRFQGKLRARVGNLVALKRVREELTDRNQRLERVVAELEAANEELDAFSYSVSHDLRAPLRALDGFAQILLEDAAPVLNEENRNYLVRIQRGAHTMKT